jgi:phytoene dehydrogenase-like protein
MGAQSTTTVAIIGAGIAGLSTGCYLQMNGYAAHIYEAHTKPGGLCTSWEREGYTIDCCVHWLTGSRPGAGLYSLWQEIGLIQGLDLFYHEEFGRSEFPDGPTVIMYTDADRLEKHLLEIAPEDAKVTKSALKAVRLLATHELPSDLPPQELMRPGQMLRLLPTMSRFLPLLRKWNSINTAEFAARFKNPYLRGGLVPGDVGLRPSYDLGLVPRPAGGISAGGLAPIGPYRGEALLGPGRSYRLQGSRLRGAG